MALQRLHGMGCHPGKSFAGLSMQHQSLTPSPFCPCSDRTRFRPVRRHAHRHANSDGSLRSRPLPRCRLPSRLLERPFRSATRHESVLRPLHPHLRSQCHSRLRIVANARRGRPFWMVSRGRTSYITHEAIILRDSFLAGAGFSSSRVSSPASSPSSPTSSSSTSQTAPKPRRSYPRRSEPSSRPASKPTAVTRFTTR